MIAGGGNTSFKNAQRIWVKASGTPMSDITSNGFAELERELLKVIYIRKYSSDSITREAEVKEDLYRACVPGNDVRPSVETSLHEIINYAYVVHTHPTLVNAITCSLRAEQTIKELFGSSTLFIPYTDPGYILFTQIRDRLYEWRRSHDNDPKIIFLQNHGVFVSADTTSEIKSIYESVESVIKSHITNWPGTEKQDEVPYEIINWLPAIRMIFSDSSVKLTRILRNSLTEYFTASAKRFKEISKPFTPDQIVYCKAYPLFLESATPDEIINECRIRLKEFNSAYGYMPRIIGVKNYGIIAVEDSIRSTNTALDIFHDWMKISYLANNFGGPNYLSDRDVSFIDNWEVENYRRKVAKSAKSSKGRVENKIIVVTGGAQGFGEGISENMISEGGNVVVADVNYDKGNALIDRLNKISPGGEAIFSFTDVTDQLSVKQLIYQVVTQFGGIDVFISNAGILKAGGLDEMTMETFEAITKVNYTGYFICTRFASEIMKLQSNYSEYYTDIIQINSKSGLKGSNRNFAYSGSKFGAIGLTQSFALELMPWHIKVNSICPGNFFEGPLWSDPETGLFVQYLRTGKVPGAKTIAEVKAHYERQVPAGRGCRVEDVMKAIYYLIEQEYETGQALPVTGGQEMLR